jgi:hypothetical protein
MAAEYKETVARRYHMVTGEHAEDSTIESLISSGESESFMQKAIQDQGRGQVMDTISEIQERHDAVKDIERSLMDLHQVFLDMAALVEAQGAQINDIESHVAHASSFVRRGHCRARAGARDPKGGGAALGGSREGGRERGAAEEAEWGALGRGERLGGEEKSERGRGSGAGPSG